MTNWFSHDRQLAYQDRYDNCCAILNKIVCSSLSIRNAKKIQHFLHFCQLRRKRLFCKRRKNYYLGTNETYHCQFHRDGFDYRSYCRRGRRKQGLKSSMPKIHEARTQHWKPISLSKIVTVVISVGLNAFIGS